MDLTIEKDSWVVSVLIPIKKFHSLFSTEANYITFLTAENKDRKYYKDEIISPSMAVVPHLQASNKAGPQRASGRPL